MAIRMGCRRLACGLLLAWSGLAPGLVTGEETLTVVKHRILGEAYPALSEKVTAALEGSGYPLRVVEVPGDRSLHIINEGKAALEMIRSRAVAADYANLIPLQPPVFSVEFTMVTSARTPEFCQQPQEAFAQMSVIGAQGMLLYEEVYFPHFGEVYKAPGTIAVARAVASQRADVTFMPVGQSSQLPTALGEALHFCGTHRTRFNFHVHLHKDYAWAKDRLEEALADVFNGPKETTGESP